MKAIPIHRTARRLALVPLLAMPLALPAATIPMNNTAGDYLEVSGNDPADTTYAFSGTRNQYDPSVLTTGLRYAGGGELSSAATFAVADANGSPIVGAIGGTILGYSGYWAGDGGNSKSQLVVTDGSVWRLEADAHLSFILDGSLFTRQLWVNGDGTGTLELAQGFIADRTANGTIGDGLGSIRLSNTTLVTHHSQSLPVALRPDGAGGLQVNGHLVFENAAGSTWITRSNPQAYAGAVWIGVDTTFRTEADLTHTGVTQFSSHFGNYWADNAFQTTAADLQLTKSGPGSLVFAAETAFLPGTVLTVEDGAVVFQTDPAAGKRKGSGSSVEGGPNLQLVVGREGADYRDARARFEAPLSRFESLTVMQGRVELLGLVQVQSFSSNHQDKQPDQNPPPPLVQYPSVMQFHLDTLHGRLEVAGEAALGGRLLLTRAEGFGPPAGTVFDLIVAGGISSGPNGIIPRFESVEDRTGLGLIIEYLDDRLRVTTTRTARTTGVVIDEDWTSGAFGDPGWRFMDSRAAFTPTGRPDIPMALTRPVNTSFIWGVAVLDTPGFHVGDDEVLVLKMVTFSDVAYNNAEFAKPEVACLHLNEHAPWGHDHATEASRNYFTSGNWQQLKPSVENDDVTAFPGIHQPGGDNATTLAQKDTSLVVFRPQGAQTNSEAHGNRNQQQATHNRAMQHWNNIQISFPAQYAANRSPVLRGGVALEDALIGMSHAHVGVTRRSDANLDYATDARDFIHWNSFRGGAGTLLWSGDFDNDGATGASDLAVWLADAGMVHDPDFERPVAMLGLADLPGAGTPPGFTYDWASGELALSTNGSAVSAWILPGPPPLAVAPAFTGAGWWQARVRGAEQWVDTSLAGVEGSHIVATLAAGLTAADLGEAVFGYAGGGGGSAPITVVGAPPASFGEWASHYGLSGEDALPDAVPFNDGSANLFKYGIGMPGDEPAAGRPEAQAASEGEASFLQIEFTRPRGRADLATTGWASRDLVQWSADPAQVEVAVTDNGDGSETVRVRALAPLDGAADPVFLKLEFGLVE